MRTSIALLVLAALAFIAPRSLVAQSDVSRLSLDVHLAVPIMAGNTMREGDVGGGVGISYSATRRIELVVGADAFDKPRPQVCPLDPGTSCDGRFLRGLGTLAMRWVLLPDATVTPYLSAGGYLTRWSGFFYPPSEPTEQVSGSGPSGAMAAFGIRMSGSPRSRFFGHLGYAALLDLAGGTGGVLRFGAGWRL